jgi:carbon-monoxide dehydrogenase small subunit
MIVMLDALLRDNPTPTDTELIDNLSGNLCRCTGYQQVIDAVHATIAAVDFGRGDDGETA